MADYMFANIHFRFFVLQILGHLYYQNRFLYAKDIDFKTVIEKYFIYDEKIKKWRKV